MRPPPLRRSRILLVTLIGFCFLASFVFLAIFPADFSPPLQHKQFIGEISSIVKNLSPRHAADALKLNSVEQEIGEGLKEPTGFVLKDRNWNASNESVANWSSDDSLLRTSGSQLSNGGGELRQHNVTSPSDGRKQEQHNQPTVGERNGRSRERSMTYEKVSEMEDQVIIAKTYLHFASPNSNSHLVRELKQRIKEIEKVVGLANKDSSLPRGALQKMRAMEDTLSKANNAYPDCSASASKLRAMTQNTEEQLRTQKNQASYLIQITASTFPKGLHCLSMRLTTEYFSLQPLERELPNRHKVQKADLYHYAIFSDNVLACAVVVNSTISTSLVPEKIVFHVVTDSLNLPALTMWFLMNPPGEATIHIQSLDDFKWLPPDFSVMYKQSGVWDPRYTSPLNHLRFYLPDLFPYLNKILFLDHDVVVQKDLSELWRVDMKGKVIGVVETCKDRESSNRLEVLVDFSEPTIAKKFEANACLWAFGMNMFDLHEWRRRGLTRVYNKWLQLGRRRQSWKAGSLPLGQLTFYNRTVTLDRQWHVLGLGRDSSLGKMEVERAAVIHYNGQMKPWLEIGLSKYRAYWNKFLKYEQPILQQCNIHE